MSIQLTREQVMDIAAPPRTKTWGVLSHGQVVAAMDAGCRNLGLIPEGDDFKETYSVNKKGEQMFSTWSFGNEEIVPVIGFRNSIDKTLSWGIAAGAKVYVCANMVFSGDYTNFQKHIGKLNYDTAFDFATNTIGSIYKRSIELVNWNYSLRDVDLDIFDQKAYMYDQLVNGIVKLTQLDKHKQCLTRERLEARKQNYSPFSLFTNHSATTRLLRNRTMSTVFDRTNTLVGITDDYYRKLAA